MSEQPKMTRNQLGGLVIVAVLALAGFTTPAPASGQTQRDLDVRKLRIAECRAYANPRWLAVTVIEERSVDPRTFEVVSSRDGRRAERIIDRCKVVRILEPATAEPGAGRGRAVIEFDERTPTGDYYTLLVVESPRSICAALPDCAVPASRSAVNTPRRCGSTAVRCFRRASLRARGRSGRRPARAVWIPQNGSGGRLRCTSRADPWFRIAGSGGRVRRATGSNDLDGDRGGHDRPWRIELVMARSSATPSMLVQHPDRLRKPASGRHARFAAAATDRGGRPAPAGEAETVRDASSAG